MFEISRNLRFPPVARDVHGIGGSIVIFPALGDRADFFLPGLRVVVIGLQPLRDLRRDSAARRIAFNIFDHLQLGLAEIADEVAGFTGWRLALAGRLDHVDEFLRLFAQRHERLRAGLQRTIRGRRRWESGAKDVTKRDGAVLGKCVLALPVKREAAVSSGDRLVGIEPDRFIIVDECTTEIALLANYAAVANVGIRLVRIEPNGGVVVVQGLVEVSPFANQALPRLM